MERALIFAAAFTFAALFALVRGGAPERWAAALYTAAYAVTIALALFKSSSFQTIEWGIFAVDIALMVSLVILALIANRYWTLWAASLQVVGILAHLAKLMVPEILAPAYAATLLIWSYAAVPLLITGTIRHRKRISHYGSDASWTPA